MASKDRKNDTEVKKHKCFPDIIDCIDKYFNFLLKGVAIIGLLASVLATISLFYYSRKENVDIFSHYSSWVPSLPIIAFADILVALFFASIIFFPAFSFHYYINKFPRRKSVESSFKKMSKQFALLVVVPGGLAVFFMYPSSLWGCKWLLLAVILIYPVATSLLFYYWFKEGIILAIVSAIPPFVSFMSTVLFFVPEWSFAVFIIWLLILGASFGWLYFRAREENELKKYGVEISIYSVVIFIMFITPFSSIIAKGSLHLLGKGGDVKRVYYISKRNEIPSPFIDNTCCDDYGFCLTEELSIKWAGGDLVYASLAEEKGNQAIVRQTIALPAKILFRYSLDDEGELIEGVPRACKTQKKLIKAANEEKEGKK